MPNGTLPFNSTVGLDKFPNKLQFQTQRSIEFMPEAGVVDLFCCMSQREANYLGVVGVFSW